MPDYSKCPIHDTEATYPHLSGRPVCEICEAMTESQIWIAIHDCIEAERERCAKICDDRKSIAGHELAARIREGK